jgi:hypothetical protein
MKTFDIFKTATTFEELKALVGHHDEFQTPIGPLKAIGCGRNGDILSVHFHDDSSYNLVATWNTATGFSTIEESKIRGWNENWDKLSKPSKELVGLMLPELDDLPIARRKAPGKLVAIACRRAVKSGALPLDTCSRCHGSGNYSYCQRYGTTCFKCGGSGKTLPSVTKCLKALKAL